MFFNNLKFQVELGVFAKGNDLRFSRTYVLFILYKRWNMLYVYKIKLPEKPKITAAHLFTGFMIQALKL